MRDETSAIDDRELQDALRNVDAASPARRLGIDAAELVAAAGRRRARSRQLRVAGAAAVLVLAAVMLRDSSQPASSPHRVIAQAPGVASEEGMEQLHNELARLDREAALKEQVVRGLRRAERLAAQEAELAVAMKQAPPPVLAAQEASRAAAISLQYATIVEHELHDLNAARLEYQRVSDRFPGTEWAAMAVASLERLPPN